MAALAVAVIALLLVLLRGGGAYTIHAQFEDAGQLVNGDLVELGGRSVGKVSRLAVTPDGLADATLRIDDGSVTPLRMGTTATIRSVGLASITKFRSTPQQPADESADELRTKPAPAAPPATR